ncbi:DUF1564 family protein [Leptospira licerasiae]|uniref:PF07600 family protein n=1 Tax=Leptospira licerasiae str. MMD4847 TaxID=1049971 RepID=A0ABP2RHE6_9LEPT|nr:DUF1564 family protein [Leptospira licerasiae]EIE01166.1 PF07600 family protein [Leptospira licerasiae serovar Varillal str. VAR 010]EJZ43887.1 PF07600 family protein [Leptospira licerasiae str. MMD4847]
MEKLKPTFYRSFSRNISLENKIPKKRKVSTLLIPPHLAKYVRKQGINYLLKKALAGQLRSFHSSRRINSQSIYTKYQNIRGRSKENRYIKFNFRPKSEDWTQLRSLAISHGVSMCYLFVLLLEEYKSKGFSYTGKTIWQIKAAIHTNFESNIFFRELLILEYPLAKSDFNGKRKDPHRPKIA